MLAAVVVGIGALIGIGLTSAVAAAVVGFITIADDIFLRPVLIIEQTIIAREPAPRLLLFGLWLLLTLGSALTLLYLLARTRPSDAIVVILAASLGSVLLSISLTAWFMMAVLGLPIGQ